MKTITTCIALLLAVSTYAQTTLFNCEQDFKTPARIPQAVLTILRKTEGEIIQDSYGFKRKDVNCFTSVSGAVVQLTSSPQKAMIIEGVCGADNIGFWLFEQQNGQWRLIFHDRGLNVTLMKMPAHRHRKLVFSACWANGCHERNYKYIKDAYQQYKCVEITDVGRKPCK